MSSSTEQPSSSGAAEVERARSNVLDYLKTLMRENTKQETKNDCIEELLKLFRRYPSLINCRYTIQTGHDYTPLICFMLQNNLPLTTIQELIGISTDVATTVSMYSWAAASGGHIPMNFACETGQSDLMILLATSSPKVVTSEIFDKFFLLQRRDDDEEEEMHNACSVEMLRQLLDINPKANVSDMFVDRALSYNNKNHQGGTIPLNLLEKLIDNCTHYDYSNIRIPESNNLSLEAIKIVCKILPKMLENHIRIETTSRQWDAPSFVHLLQEIESNKKIKSLELLIPNIQVGNNWDKATDQVASAMEKMMKNNTVLKYLEVCSSSDGESTRFWLYTALKALPSANKALSSLFVCNEMGFSVSIKLAEEAEAATDSTTTVRLPIECLSSSSSSSESNNNNIILDFVGETLPTMCCLQKLEITGNYRVDETVSSSCKETTTRLITSLVRNSSNSSNLEAIMVLDGNKKLQQPAYKGIQIDLVGIAKALENNKSLRQFRWQNCNQEISKEEIQAMRDVLKDHNTTLMQFTIIGKAASNNNNNHEYFVDPQISYYVDLNWRGRSKLVSRIANSRGAAVEDLIYLLTCPINSSISGDRTGAKKLGIWYGLLREAPAVWSSSNNLPIISQGKGDSPHHRKRKRGEV